MTKFEFLSGLQNELELESKLTDDVNIKELDEWDSMSAMVLIGFVSNNFNINFNAEDIKSITTISSLIKRIGEEKFS